MQDIFRRIYGECPYKSPTDMGVNMVGFAISDDAVCRQAAKDEIIRRYYAAACAVRRDSADASQVQKLEFLMNALSIAPTDRACVPPALSRAAETGLPATAITLADGRVVTGRTSELLGCASAALLNALKALAGIDDAIQLLSPAVITPIQSLKTGHLGNRNPRLHTDEILIALSICAVTNPTAALALSKLDALAGCQAHTSVILSSVDEMVFKNLGMHITCEPVYQSQRLYHK